MAEEKKTTAKKPAAKKTTTAKKPAAAKTAKETKKVEKPAKPQVTSAKAVATNVRITPRKARLVIDLVRGKKVSDAIALLKMTNKAASEPVMKVIKSAAANAVNNFGMDESSLYIAEIYANDGLKMKRYLPRAKGSASGLVKRDAHITCVVKAR